MTATDENAEFDSVESLLPWYASGKLAPEELQRVEEALAEVPELRRRYELILEERAAAAALNEGLGAPSPRARERLFARLESAAPQTPERQHSGPGNWLAGLFSAWQPRSLALAGMAAALVAMIEAGVLATMFFGAPYRGTTYETASVSEKSAGGECHFLLLAIAPEATAAQIEHFLETYKASFADGPAAGGIYRIRVCEKSLTANELSAIVAAMRKESSIVRFVAPARP
jgi:hypothetical protein